MTDLADIFIPPPPPEVPKYSFGTVTATSPLAIRLDGETLPVGSTPATLAVVGVGDRVWVQIHRRQLIILGKVH